MSLNSIKQSVTPIILDSFARTRPIPFSKQHLFNKHLNLLNSNSNNLLLFLRPSDFNAEEWKKLRSSLASLTPPSSSTTTASTSTNSTAVEEEGKLKLTILRSGLIPALLKSSLLSPSIDTKLLSTQSHLKGPLAILTSSTSTLNPQTLTKILKLLKQFSNTPSANAPPLDPKSKDPTLLPNRLEVLSSLINSKAYNTVELKEIGKLPSLSVLRSQIVGLLSMPGSRIIGVLGNPGSSLLRNLEGLKEGLRLKEEGGAEKVE